MICHFYIPILLSDLQRFKKRRPDGRALPETTIVASLAIPGKIAKCIQRIVRYEDKHALRQHESGKMTKVGTSFTERNMMSGKIKSLVIILVMATAFLYVLAITGDVTNPEPTKDQTIRQLLALTKTAEIMRNTSLEMIEIQKKQMPMIPDEFWKRYKAAVESEELFEQIIPLYDKHFTHDELLRLCDFYETPIGKKLVEKLPLITSESLSIGNQWDIKTTQRIIQEMIDEGYQFPGINMPENSQ